MKCNTLYAGRSPVSPVVLDKLLDIHVLDQCIQRFLQLHVYVEKLLDTRMRARGSPLHVGQPAPPGHPPSSPLEHYPINLDHTLLSRAVNLTNTGNASAAKPAKGASAAPVTRLTC